MGEEARLEARCRRLTKDCGGVLKKIPANFSAGWPDRILLMPFRPARLVEFKAPGGQLRPIQRVVFQRLRELGHPVEVIDSFEGYSDFLISVIDGESHE